MQCGNAEIREGLRSVQVVNDEEMVQENASVNVVR